MAHRQIQSRPGTAGIIGAGVSGLAAGIAPLRSGIPVTVCEASDVAELCRAHGHHAGAGTAGGSIIALYPSIEQDRPVGDWDDERANAIADAAIEALSRRHRLEIAVKRVRSPKILRDRMHLYDDPIYGLSSGADALAQFPHTTANPGLFLAGQTTWPGDGVGTALMSGILAAEARARRAA